jgi:hypothetical protein
MTWSCIEFSLHHQSYPPVPASTSSSQYYYVMLYKTACMACGVRNTETLASDFVTEVTGVIGVS